MSRRHNISTAPASLIAPVGSSVAFASTSNADACRVRIAQSVGSEEYFGLEHHPRCAFRGRRSPQVFRLWLLYGIPRDPVRTRATATLRARLPARARTLSQDLLLHVRNPIRGDCTSVRLFELTSDSGMLFALGLRSTRPGSGKTFFLSPPRRTRPPCPANDEPLRRRAIASTD